MAHPLNEHRAHKVERARVKGHIAGYEDHGAAEHKVKHYAKGGAVHSDEAEDKKLVKKMLKEHEKTEKNTGGSVSFRADRRARGGKVKGKKGNTTVNVVVGHHGMPPGGPPPMASAPQAVPPRPLAPPIPPAGGPPMAPAPGGAMMPPPGIRATGGRAYASGGHVKKGVDSEGDNAADRMVSGKGKSLGGLKNFSEGAKSLSGAMDSARARNYGEGVKRATGGGVNGVYPTSKGTPVWREGVNSGTPVQHSGNKMDGQNMGRDKVVTYKTGGAVEHAVKGQMAPHLPSGSGGGKARLAKEKRAAKSYHAPAKGVNSNATGK